MDDFITTDNVVTLIQSLGIVLGVVIGSIFFAILGKGENRFQFFRRRSFRALVRLRIMHAQIHAMFNYRAAREDLINAIAFLEDLNSYEGDDFLSKTHVKETFSRFSKKRRRKGGDLITEVGDFLNVHRRTLIKLNGGIDIEKSLFEELEKITHQSSIQIDSTIDLNNAILAPREKDEFYNLTVINSEINERLKDIYCKHYFPKKRYSKTNTEASIFKLDKYDDLIQQTNNLNYMDLDTAHGSSLVEINKKLDRISEVLNDD